MSRRRYPRRRYKKRIKGKSGFWRNTRNVMATATTALAIAKGVKSLLNVEFKKHTDVSGSIYNANILSTGTVYYLPQIAVGDGDTSERIGSKIKMTMMQWKGKINFTTGGNQNQAVRVIIFQDKNFRGTNPPTVSGTIDSVLYSSNPHTFRRLDNVGRFKILSDKTYVVSDEESFKQFSITYTKPKHIEFQGDTAAQASGGADSLWVIFISDQTVSNYPTLEAVFRMRYVDN